MQAPMERPDGGTEGATSLDPGELEVVPLRPVAADNVPAAAATAAAPSAVPAAPVGTFVLADDAEDGSPDGPKQLSVPGMVAAVNAASGGPVTSPTDVGYPMVATQTSTEDEDSYVVDDVSEGHDSVLKELQKVDDGTGETRVKKRYATSSYLVGSKLLSNAKKKAEDIAFGVITVTSDIGELGGKVGGAAVSSAGAIGDSLTAGFEGAPSAAELTPLVAREVDTLREVDVPGTVINDLNRQIAEQQAVGANTTDSPLNQPFVLLIAPIGPLAVMYGWTIFDLIAPPLWNAAVAVWSFFGWRFWYCLAVGAVIGVVAGWGTIKDIEALRPITMQVEVQLVQATRAYHIQRARQLPKVYKAVDRILPPLRAAVYDLDKNVLIPRLGYSPLLALRAKVYGWVYDARIASFSHHDGDARITISTPDGVSTTRTGPAQFRAAASGGHAAAAAAAAAAGPETVDPRLRPENGGVGLSANGAAAAGLPTPTNREGAAPPKAHNAAGDAADDAAEAAAADARAARILELARARPGAVVPEAYEKFFSVTLTLLNVGELHRKYQSVWLEWHQDGMVIDRSVVVDVNDYTPGKSTWLKGPGADFKQSTLSHEVRLTYDPKRDVGGASVKHAHGDYPIMLVLKGRDGMPLYSNDGARRYQRQHTATVRIAEICLSAKSAGVGHVNNGRVESDLCIPMHARGVERYRSAVLVARATIDSVNASSYSYRQNLSPLPAGEWTVRATVHELRNLRGVDLSGSSDPYVNITALDSTKSTDTQRKTLTCVVDQLLFFSKVLTGVQMEQQRVKVEVMDWNRFAASVIIGTYTLDARKILDAPGGEIAAKWFALSNPMGGKRPAGFIKLSVAVQPPGGELPAHDGGEDPDERTNASLLKNALITPPVMDYKTFAVHICVGWADMLPRMTDSGRAGALASADVIRGYMVFEYTGYAPAQSRTFLCEARDVTDPNVGSACLVEPQRRLIWNEEFVLPLTVVNGQVSQEGVVVKLFHGDSGSTSKFIGQVTLSFAELFANRGLAIVRGQAADGEKLGDRVTEAAMLRPRYYNFYGVPEGAADRSDKGVSFRGRVLMGAAAKACDWPAPVLRTCPAPPRPKLEFYSLDLAVLRATELPLPDGWLVTVHGRLGLFTFGHTIPPVSVRNTCATWDGSSAVRIPNIQFPEDVEQIPDLFITLWACKPKTVELLEDQSAAENARLGATSTTNNSLELDPNRLEAVGVVDADTMPEGTTAAVAAEPATAERAADGGDVGGGTGASGKIDSTSESSWNPFAFVRLSAKHLVLPQPSPKWMFMDYPGNDVLTESDKVPGSLLALASLRRFDPMDAVPSLAPATVNGTDPSALAPAHVISEPAAVPGELEGKPEKDAAVGEEVTASAPPTVGPTGAVPAGATRIPQEPLGTNDAVIQPVEPGSDAVNGGGTGQPEIAPASATHPRVMAPTTTASAAVGGTFSLPLGMERVYELRALILQGRDLPAADETGLSDPFVHVSMGDQFKKGTIIRCDTVAPLWEELIQVEGVTIRDGERRPNVNVLVYDWDEDGTFDYLGRAIIPSAELDDIEPSVAHAKWYPVFSVNPDVKVGEILADFQLIEQHMALSRPITAPVPVRTQSALRVSLLGLRDVHFYDFASGNLFVECSVSGFEGKPIRSKHGAILQQRNYEGNCNILDVLVLDIGIPEDLRLAPALNVYVYTELAHKSGSQLLATTCIPLQGWLSAHERKLLSGVALIDDSFGLDAPIPESLAHKYRFRRHTHVINAKAGTVMSLHEMQLADIPGQDVVPYAPSSERAVDTEEEDNILDEEGTRHLRIGFPDPPPEPSAAAKAAAAAAEKAQAAVGALAMIPKVLRGVKYTVTNAVANIMPDVALALGIDAEEEVPLVVTRGHDNERDTPYDGTAVFKEARGFCENELENDFNAPSYTEFPLFRGDSRSLGAGGAALSRNVLKNAGVIGGVGGVASDWFKRLIPVDEVSSASTLKEKEFTRAALAGTRPPVGQVKARLDLVEVDTEDETELQKTRLTSLRSFGRVFVPTEVLVRVYVLRGCHLQQVGSTCNPYLTARFFGGYPDFFSRKQSPVHDTENPDFYDMFEARVKMPGGSVRIQIKDRVLPEINLPIAIPNRSDEGGWIPALRHSELPINAGKLGLGWSEDIGETTIDLDSRWYNAGWRALDKSPVESRSLFKEGSLNARGSVELWVDIFDAKEVDKRPRLYRPIPVAPPVTRKYFLRVVIFKVADVMLPYKLANYDPNKLAALKVEARLGNRVVDQRQTDTCKYVGDGVGPFNWRMQWELNLPSVEVKPRLKLQVFDGTTLCGVGDVKLRTMFDDMIANPRTIIKNKQYVMLYHPNHPEVEVRAQIALEFLPADEAATKKCKLGKQAWSSRGQHIDYVLPEPFRPAAFSLFNPVPFFYYMIVSTLQNIVWQVVYVLLLFPFIPFAMQMAAYTPWQWYLAAGMCGLVVFIRVMLVQAARTARLTQDQDEEEYEREQYLLIARQTRLPLGEDARSVGAVPPPGQRPN